MSLRKYLIRRLSERLTSSKEGQKAAQELMDSKVARELTEELKKSDEVRKIVKDIIGSDRAKEVAKDAAKDFLENTKQKMKRGAQDMADTITGQINQAIEAKKKKDRAEKMEQELDEELAALKRNLEQQR